MSGSPKKGVGAPFFPSKRLVLDTNIWLDWLVFEDTGIAHIRQLQEAGRLEIVVDAVCEAEFAEVITRKFQKKSLDRQAQAAALARLRRLSTRIDARPTTPERARLPACRDPDDQKFLELALAAGADVLVTKDRALLELARRRKKQVGRTVPFHILTPLEFEEF
jgi:putative PIN family toxin of toxin-antitoxin system